MVEMKDSVVAPTPDAETSTAVKASVTDSADAKMEDASKVPEAEDPANDPKLKRMIELDTSYMSLENEYAVEWAELQKKYAAKQKPLLEERQQIVAKGEIPRFWLQCFEGHPIFNDEIQSWDQPVLELLKDVRVEDLEDDSGKNQKGFKIVFDFNYPEGSEEADKLPFTNKELVRIYETGLENEFLTEITVKRIYMEEEIEWKVGQDITIEMKRSTGGDKKKGKDKKPKVEKVERASFFRLFFRSITMEEPDKLKDLLDKSLLEMGFDAADIDDEDELEQAYEDALEKVSDDAYEMGLCLRDNIIPFAVRWFTGQACPMEDEDDEGDEDDDEDDSGDEDEDEESGDEAETGEVFKKDNDKKGVFEKSGKDGDKKEECKQQ